jgi:microcystin-dependent protein
MPSSNGVYSLPTGYLAVTGSTILASQHNPPLEDIAAALTNRLSRDGTAPMTGPVQLAVGTVSLPGAVFSTDLTSGWYKTTSGIGVAINGVKVAEFLSGGVVGAREVGELVPYTGLIAPSPLWLIPVGQTVSRTTYAALWAFAQIQIAAGGNLLYNNGDGSTTFGIMDMRGRAAADPSATVLNSFAMTPDGNTLGAKGGTQAVTLAATQIPALSSISTDGFNVSVTSTVTNVVQGLATVNLAGGGSPVQLPSGATGAVVSTGTVTAGNVSSVTNNTGGQAHLNVQPTITTNYLLFAGGAL